MQDLSFVEIGERINKLILPSFDLVIGIATGGVVAASLVAYKLGIELKVIQINYRDEENHPRYDNPKLFGYGQVNISGKKLLIVDDVSVSGKTLEAAVKIFAGNEIKTFVLKGKADYVLFPEIAACVNWPWKLNYNKNTG